MESTSEGVPRVGLRVALGAVILALGWLVVGALFGGDSASAAGIPPPAPDASSTQNAVAADALVPDALDAAVLAETRGLGRTTLGHMLAATTVVTDMPAAAAGTVTVTAATTATAVDDASVAVDEFLVTLPAVAAVTGPRPIRGLTAPVVRAATDALDRVADTVALAAVADILPELLPEVPDPVPDALPAVYTLLADLGGPVTAEPPALASSPSNDASPYSSSALLPASDATNFTASEPIPPPVQPSTPGTPSDALVPTATATFAAECDLSRSQWALLVSCSAVLPPGNDELPSPPAFDFDPTPD